MSHWIKVLQECCKKKTLDLVRYLDANPQIELIIEKGIYRNEKLSAKKGVYDFQLEQMIQKWKETQGFQINDRQLEELESLEMINGPYILIDYKRKLCLKSQKNQIIILILLKKLMRELVVQRQQKLKIKILNNKNINKLIWRQQKKSGKKYQNKEKFIIASENKGKIINFQVPRINSIDKDEFDEFPQYIKQYYYDQDKQFQMKLKQIEQQKIEQKALTREGLNKFLPFQKSEDRIWEINMNALKERATTHVERTLDVINNLKMPPKTIPKNLSQDKQRKLYEQLTEHPVIGTLSKAVRTAKHSLIKFDAYSLSKPLNQLIEAEQIAIQNLHQQKILIGEMNDQGFTYRQDQQQQANEEQNQEIPHIKVNKLK